jgi:hypothetical protein
MTLSAAARRAGVRPHPTLTRSKGLKKPDFNRRTIWPQMQLHGTVGKLIEAITEFFEEAEKNVSAHPAAHVIGGIVAGILIGRLLGRR